GAGQAGEVADVDQRGDECGIRAAGGDRRPQALAAQDMRLGHPPTVCRSAPGTALGPPPAAFPRASRSTSLPSSPASAPPCAPPPPPPPATSPPAPRAPPCPPAPPGPRPPPPAPLPPPRCSPHAPPRARAPPPAPRPPKFARRQMLADG